jgi:hypothetical protein
MKKSTKATISVYVFLTFFLFLFFNPMIVKKHGGHHSYQKYVIQKMDINDNPYCGEYLDLNDNTVKPKPGCEYWHKNMKGLVYR